MNLIEGPSRFLGRKLGEFMRQRRIDKAARDLLLIAGTISEEELREFIEMTERLKKKPGLEQKVRNWHDDQVDMYKRAFEMQKTAIVQ